MGHHYVPQKYLRGFSGIDTDKVWMYDKKKRQFSEAAISKVAQESSFYEDDVEVELNAAIESPTNPIIDKLRRREAINAEERVRLALYIAVMLMRVPNRRLRRLKDTLELLIAQSIG